MEYILKRKITAKKSYLSLSKSGGGGVIGIVICERLCGYCRMQQINECVNIFGNQSGETEVGGGTL